MKFARPDQVDVRAGRVFWLAALTGRIPKEGEHLVRYYGWYSNVCRGRRRRAEGEAPATPELVEVPVREAERE